MRRALLLGAALALFTTDAIPEGDPQSARSFYLEQTAAFSQKPAAAYAVARDRPVRGKLGPDPSIVALVDAVATEAGIPVSIMRFHVARESGYQPGARNPKSTAKGLLQVIRGTHEAIIGRRMTLDEHLSLMAQPRYALEIGAAHIKACRDLMPAASAEQLWRRCHVAGHASVGGRTEMAARHYRPDANGWLARGTVAMPWSGRGA